MRCPCCGKIVNVLRKYKTKPPHKLEYIWLCTECASKQIMADKICIGWKEECHSMLHADLLQELRDLLIKDFAMKHGISNKELRKLLLAIGEIFNE